MDIDNSFAVKVPAILLADKVLYELKSLVIVGTSSNSSAFKAQDSMENLEQSKLVNIKLDYLEGVPQLLYSEDILQAMKEIQVKLPYVEVLEVKRKIKVLIGVR